AASERERLQDVALPGAVLAGEDQVLLASHEVEARKFHDERAIELWLKVEVEGFEVLSLAQAAGLHAPLDAVFELDGSLLAEHAVEQIGSGRSFARRPRAGFVQAPGNLPEAQGFRGPSDA